MSFFSILCPFNSIAEDALQDRIDSFCQGAACALSGYSQSSISCAGDAPPISAETLAELLDVSVRTIYRDIATLQSMGAPIRGEGGLGYQIEAGFFLPPLHFDPDELDALILGIRMVTVRGDEKLGSAATRLLGKIEAVLSEGAHALNQPLLAVGAGKKSETAFGLTALKAAVRRRKKVELKISRRPRTRKHAHRAATWDYGL
ncbi:helix-turn-helix transcriptional regulator [Litoreibacter albidus]|uniref:helix-turn-helix transcriptional regulator n=1 Tax=Litoreibacter albidus TaxID=670155 RepID=UPI003735E68A